MAYMSTSNKAPQAGMQECSPLPPCPECGGLECLCRPRFFAGQLLTEEDLNRLEHYVVEKNKLHNRYLHGWGVVCGLEVVCGPCHNMVHVKPGYALSPCGEDIIVCKDDSVDVCALIKACRPVTPYRDCEMPHSANPEDCRDVTEDWVLAICYDERPSRGIAALRDASGAACCSRCACGGSSACGCSCHAASKANNGSMKPNCGPSTSRNPPPQCEPTQICEGYFYRVYKAPPRKEGDTQEKGRLVARFEACLKCLVQQIPTIPGPNSNQAQLRLQRQQWCCSIKETLRDFLITEGVYDCSIADKLTAIQCPDPSSTNFNVEWQQVVQRLAAVIWEFYRFCICSALLPPCPEPVTDNCVPLATITIRRRDCHIVQVCDWGPRKFVVTFPNLGYWLSTLPYARSLRKAIEQVCCHPLPFREGIFTAGQPVEAVPRAAPDIAPPAAAEQSEIHPTGTTEKMTPERELSTLLLQALANKERGFDVPALLVLNILGAADANGNPVLSQLEHDNPLQFLLLNQVVAPLVERTLPERIPGLLGVSGLGAAMRETSSVQAAELANLRKTVEQLQKKVDELSSRTGG